MRAAGNENFQAQKECRVGGLGFRPSQPAFLITGWVSLGTPPNISFLHVFDNNTATWLFAWWESTTKLRILKNVVWKYLMPGCRYFTQYRWNCGGYSLADSSRVFPNETRDLRHAFSPRGLLTAKEKYCLAVHGGSSLDREWARNPFTGWHLQN